MAHWAAPQTISAAMTGDLAAVERLLTDIWPPCYRLAATLIGDPALAQDAAQEACAIVHGKVRALRSAEKFDAWIYRIVLHEAARARRRRPLVCATPDTPYIPPDTAASIDIWRALDALPRDQRDVVVLFYFNDLTTEKIAEVLCIPHATVRTRLARARDRLRPILDDYRTKPAPIQELKEHVL